MKHAPEHDELLERALTGELAPDAAPLVEHLRDCAECARAWKSMNDITAALDSTRRELPGDLRAALQAGPAPGADRVLATLRAAAARESTRTIPTVRASAPRSTSRRWWIGAAAAALLALAAWAVIARLEPERRPDDPFLLGDSRFEMLAPQGAWTGVERFSWKHTLAPLGRYELQIEGLDEANGTWKPIEHGAGALHSSTWDPPPSAVDWPWRIRWRVLAFDPGAEPVASRWVELSRLR